LSKLVHVQLYSCTAAELIWGGDTLVSMLVGLVREEYARLWGIDISKQVGGG
jgi:hypothetical protein